MHQRPLFEGARIEPEEVETVVKVSPTCQGVRQRFVKSDPFGRHFTIATRTRQRVRRQVWLKDQWRNASADAEFLHRSRWWRSQFPVWVFLGLHHCFRVRLTAQRSAASRGSKLFRI